jgi:hypothetical protein
MHLCSENSRVNSKLSQQEIKHHACCLLLTLIYCISFTVKRTRHRADINPIAIKSLGKRLEVQNEGDSW